MSNRRSRTCSRRATGTESTRRCRSCIDEALQLPAEVAAQAGKGDLIELYNAGDASADLSGYRLTDDMTLPVDKTYVFSPGTTLAPGASLVLGELPFGLAQDKEETLGCARNSTVCSECYRPIQ